MAFKMVVQVDEPSRRIRSIEEFTLSRNNGMCGRQERWYKLQNEDDEGGPVGLSQGYASVVQGQIPEEHKQGDLALNSSILAFLV